MQLDDHALVVTITHDQNIIVWVGIQNIYSLLLKYINQILKILIQI